MCILKALQGQCWANAKSSFLAEAKPALAGDFSEIGCKGTTFCAHSQIKCTKSAPLCTMSGFCANYYGYCFGILSISSDLCRMIDRATVDKIMDAV